MKLYNTLSRSIEELEPDSNHAVRMYICGVTVYDSSHIGHARTIIVFDVLRRYLLSRGLNVVFVQNFTDVDDKIINRAKAEGVQARDIAERYIKSYFKDFESLNVLKADYYPRATEHIGDMIRLIDGLVKKGDAYLTLNGVYFKVKSFSEYGKLSRKPIDELEAGARVEVDPSKQDPLDFALWKFSSENPVWESPWGKGRPGWHIECSAMALKYLGSPFEIHGGGQDLIFPHHENEIAQSESFTGKQFARIWMHAGMVTVDSVKMSKSLGNIVTIGQAVEKWGTNSLRLYCISVHYSKPLDYTEDLLKESMQRWRQIETCACELGFAQGRGGEIDALIKACDEAVKAFQSAMDDDFNTSLAITEFMKLVTQINRYAAADKLTADMASAVADRFSGLMDVLGLKLVEVGEDERKEILSLIEKRNNLRAEKKFSDADRIRQQLLNNHSVELLDHKGRTVWIKREKA
jgi:cysteinyl-tRNA synthetase